MKPESPELRALLATRQFYAADLYTISGGNLGSTVLAYCGGDLDVLNTATGVKHSAGGQTGPYFDRTDNKARCHWGTGVGADELVIDVIPGSALLFGMPFLQAIGFGVFDGAELILDKAFMPLGAYGDTSRGIRRYFVGRIAEIDAGRSVATFSIKSHLEILDIQLPRNLYQAGCVNNLGDTICGVNLASFMTTGTVQSGSTNQSIKASLAGGPFAAGAFDLGKIVMTSGVLNGLPRTVQTATLPSPSTITVLGFFPAAPAVGDTFNLFFGCDKSLGANGCPKFGFPNATPGNPPRHRGFEFVPQPATAV